MQTHILDVAVEFSHQPFRKPLQISTGRITEITQADVSLTVRVGNLTATGWGSIYLSDLWAWPEPSLSHQQRDHALRGYCRDIAANLTSLCGEPAHPLGMGLQLHEALLHQPAMYHESGQSHEIPVLARAMCASPFDAALHDAVGQALGCSAFDFYEEPCSIPAADHYFQDGAITAVRRALRIRRQVLDAWLVVGANDDLEADIVPWVKERGYRCFKLKILGRDTARDVARTVEVFRTVQSFGARSPRLCVDSNEANPDATSVLDYLQQLRDESPEAYAALEYLEQPTGRDIMQHAHDWHRVANHKPVLLDEGLTSLELLKLAKAQGWSGFALKTCKGHSFALATAAWAHENGLSLTMQDLTNPGFSAIHAFLLASHLDTLNGVELNSPQYTPAANDAWLPRLNELLEPFNGNHRMSGAPIWGLGSTL